MSGLPVDGEPAPENSSGLSEFQLEIAQLFFSLPASRGFLLTGGAALLAQHLTSRPTEDLDFFTAPERGHVPSARDELETAVRERGWNIERMQDSDTFCRLIIRTDVYPIEFADTIVGLFVETIGEGPERLAAPRERRWPSRPRRQRKHLRPGSSVLREC